jgi:hypothetical protein
MGSFNVSGTVSNISISKGEKVVFIPLLPTNYKFEKKQDIVISPKSMVVSDDGSGAFYSPRFLPIVGFYDDYGRIKNIEKDKNIEYIENYYGLSIENFISIVTDVQENDSVFEKMNSKRKDEIRALSGMFEVYDVYKGMSAYYSENETAIKKMTLTSYVIEKLGFIKQKERINDDQYFLNYVHPLAAGLEIHSDGTRSNVFLTNEDRTVNVFSPKNIEDILLERNITLPEFEFFKNKSLYSVLFDQKEDAEEKLIEKKKELNFLEKDPENMEIDVSKTIDRFKRLIEIRIEMEMEMEIGKSFSLNKFYKMDYALNKDFKESFVELLDFDRIMYSLNKFYFPAMNGKQEGDMKATKKLAELIIKYS